MYSGGMEFSDLYHQSAPVSVPTGRRFIQLLLQRMMIHDSTNLHKDPDADKHTVPFWAPLSEGYPGGGGVNVSGW